MKDIYKNLLEEFDEELDLFLTRQCCTHNCREVEACSQFAKSYFPTHTLPKEYVKEVIDEKMELHTHNSIPSYTADLDEGCILCIKNQALTDLKTKLDI